MDTPKKNIKPPKLPTGFRSLRAEKDIKEKKSEPVEYDDRPSIGFSERELPEIKDWKIGETYEITIRIEQTATRIEDYGSKKGLICSSFRIDAVSFDSEKKEKAEKKK